MAIEKRPASIEIVWNDDGTQIKGASYTEHWFSDGEFLRTVGPNDLADTSNETFASFAELFHADLIAERDALQAKLDAVVLPHNTRLIDPRAWYARFTRAEVIAIAKVATSDPVVAQIITHLDDSIALREADQTYQMSLDHENAINGTGYLQSLGILSAERVAELLSDSREDEQ